MFLPLRVQKILNDGSVSCFLAFCWHSVGILNVYQQKTQARFNGQIYSI